MLNILAPIFGLIALAYASRKLNILGPSAYIELNRFVASLALPALLIAIPVELAGGLSGRGAVISVRVELF